MHPIKFALLALMVILPGTLCFVSCSDDDSYAQRRERERNQINNFIRRGTLQLDAEGDTMLYVAPINVIDESTFAANDSTTDLTKNEYVYLENSGLYMQIISHGTGKKLADDENLTVLSRYMEVNIGGDSVQSSNLNNAYANSPEVMSCSMSSGTISGSFISGLMRSLYESSTVPSGWLIPLNYVKLGRQDGTADIAKVRIIVPSTEGQQTAMGDVYPCFYELTYMRAR